MKKSFAVVFAISILLSFVACGKENTETSSIIQSKTESKMSSNAKPNLESKAESKNDKLSADSVSNKTKIPETNITFEETIASFNETYDANNSELKSMTFTITSAPDSSENIISDSVAEKILTKVSTMKSLATYDFYSSIDILRALKRKDIDFGYCVKVDDWCIYPDYVTQNFYLFSIHRNQ